MNPVKLPPTRVDVVRLPADTSSTVLVWTSTIAVVLASVIALLAYRKIAKERRTVFELDILRDLLSRLDGTTFVTSARARALMAALPPRDIPLLREVAATVAGQLLSDAAVRRDYGEVLDRAGVPAHDGPDERLWQAVVDDIKLLDDQRVPGTSGRHGVGLVGEGKRGQLVASPACPLAAHPGEAAEAPLPRCPGSHLGRSGR